MLVDVHCHILPAVDDGAAGLAEAMQMAEAALRAGITDVIATPHIVDGLTCERLKDIVFAFEVFRAELVKLEVPLEIHPGAEIHLHHDLLEKDKLDDFFTLAKGGRYLLIELPALSIPLCADAVIDSLLDRGIVPIIAHPERNLIIQKDTSVLRRWVKKGVNTQITAEAMLGFWGRKTEKLIKNLLKENLVHLLGSDSHGLRKRPFCDLEKAYRVLYNWFGIETVRRFKGNAQNLLEGIGKCRKMG